MSLFCNSCGNILYEITSSDGFLFRCNNCSKTYEPTAADTLRYEEVRGTSLIMYKTLLQNAADDPVNPKCFKDCKKCENNLVRQVRLGEDMKLINICIKCKNTWLDSVEE